MPFDLPGVYCINISKALANIRYSELIYDSKIPIEWINLFLAYFELSSPRHPSLAAVSSTGNFFTDIRNVQFIFLKVLLESRVREHLNCLILSGKEVSSKIPNKWLKSYNRTKVLGYYPQRKWLTTCWHETCSWKSDHVVSDYPVLIFHSLPSAVNPVLCTPFCPITPRCIWHWKGFTHRIRKLTEHGVPKPIIDLPSYLLRYEKSICR